MLSKIGMWSSVAMFYSCIHSKFQVNCMKNEFLIIFSPYETLLFSPAIQSLGQAL